MNRDVLRRIRDFFAGIPAQHWCINALENREGQRCAIGHLFHEVSGDVYGPCNPAAWQHRFGTTFGGIHELLLVSVNNDADESRYVGATPRDRVLNRIDTFLQ